MSHPAEEPHAVTAEELQIRGISGQVLAEALANQPDYVQAHALNKAIRANPSVATRMLFPDEADDGRRNEAYVELRRMLDRDRAREMYDMIRVGGEQPHPVSLGAVAERLADGLEHAPTPSIGGLLYSGRVNAVYGDYTAGKTWFALYLAKANAEAGGKTLVIDYEDSAVGFAARCNALNPKLAESVVYVDGSVTVVNADALQATVEGEGVTLVVVDSTGMSLAAMGGDGNADDDVARWFRALPYALAALGPAVLLVDHVPKKNDGTPTPVGSFRKGAAITGAQFVLENKCGFSKTRAGWSKLTCTKDRCGNFATGEVVGQVKFTPEPDEGTLLVELHRGSADDPSAMNSRDALDDAILNYVWDRMRDVHGKLDENGEEMDGRPAITQIRDAVKKDLKVHNAKVRAAVDALVRGGWLAVEHLKSGKSTRDVYVPGHTLLGLLGLLGEDDDLED